jgi:hypothetical protein
MTNAPPCKDSAKLRCATFLRLARYFCPTMRTSLFTLLFASFFLPKLLAQQPDSLRTRRGAARSTDSTALNIARPTATSVDSSAVSALDSAQAKPPKTGLVRRILTKNYPNPRTAAFLSLALPGAGQAYNRKWWKIPIAWGALGGVTYFTVRNVNQYHTLRDNYKLLVDDDPDTNPTESPYNTFDADQTRGYRDQWRRYAEQSYLVLGLTYVLVATDAFVDAHLATFDVSDDLSLRARPATMSAPGFGPAFGVAFTLSVR